MTTFIMNTHFKSLSKMCVVDQCPDNSSLITAIWFRIAVFNATRIQNIRIFFVGLLITQLSEETDAFYIHTKQDETFRERLKMGVRDNGRHLSNVIFKDQTNVFL